MKKFSKDVIEKTEKDGAYIDINYRDCTDEINKLGFNVKHIRHMDGDYIRVWPKSYFMQ